jgi:ABC-2 type transport system permease protein
MGLDTNAIYVLWLREIKRYTRSKARIIGTIMMPIFFMLGLGYGLSTFIHLPNNINYFQFIVPGIIGMTLLFTGATSGFQVIWDRQFGFLKEIMVTPNSRVSITIGRVAGGATTALIPAFLVLFLAILIGFHPVLSLYNLLTIVFVILIGVVFISLGLIFAAFINDPQAFGVIVNLVTFPLLFLSGAIYPLSGLPKVVNYITYVNPLTYGVDGLRFALLGSSANSVLVDLVGITVSAIIMVALSTLALKFSHVD